MTLKTLRQRFSYIYENDVWTTGTSKSGPGSTMEGTQDVREHLPPLLQRIGTHVLLDLGCGDYGWMKELRLPVTYIGADIVEPLVRVNARDYARPNISFVCLNAVSDRLPACDTVLCRHVLFHLSFRDIRKTLRNIAKTGATYLLTTNHDSVGQNQDIISGDFRRLNLCAAPFYFPPAFAIIPDPVIGAIRTLGAWRIGDLKL